jgi:hypothetical protein
MGAIGFREAMIAYKWLLVYYRAPEFGEMSEWLTKLLGAILIVRSARPEGRRAGSPE